MSDEPRRPILSADMSGWEFRRWYWLREELIRFARSLGIATSGSKGELTERIAARLDGGLVERAVVVRRVPQLSGELSEASVIPAGQRCTQHLRAWFIDRVGQHFRFDATMREFFAAADGTTTLGDALTVWRSDARRAPREIDGQFELNRFTRSWFADNPQGSRDQMLEAWWRYRDLPIGERHRA